MSDLTKPLAKYVHLRRCGDLFFVAGQGCRDPQTNQYRGLVRDSSGKILSYDISAQSRGVLDNIERALKDVDLDRSHLLDITVFLTNMNDFPAMNAVWNEYFAEINPPPTRTTVQVTALPGDNFVEMKAIASRSKEL